jgi:Tfp pilus assembly protein PilF
LRSCNNIRHLTFALACLLLVACGGMPAQQAPAPAAATAAAPREAYSQYEYALELMREKRYDEAATALQAMTRTYPDLSGPYLNLGIAYLRMERPAEAEETVRQGLAVNPDDAEGYNLLGLVQREVGHFAEARESYEQALKLDPQFADVHLNLAILLDLYLGLSQAALEHYERYQDIAGTEDKQVKLWITDLKQRLPAADPAADKGGGS